MSMGCVFITCFISMAVMWPDDASARKSVLGPCDDKRIILETTLTHDVIENRFRLGCTSTLFTTVGGSSSVTWCAKQALVNDVWLEFYFFYEQAILLRFIKILLGTEPHSMSLTCVFDTESRHYSFFLHVDNKFVGACTNNKTSYVCSIGKMTEFFKNLEHYKGGKSIVTDLKKYAKNIQKKWFGVCKLFEILDKNATHTYAMNYDYVTDTITCSVGSSVPWHYEIILNGSVTGSTETKYNKSTDMHTTTRNVSRDSGVHFVCIVTSLYGKNVSQDFDISAFTVPITTFKSTTEDHRDSSTTIDTYTETNVKEFEKKEVLIGNTSTFGAGPVTSIVIMVLLAIGLIGSFVFREEIISFGYRFQKVPTESPYKDILMTIEK